MVRTHRYKYNLNEGDRAELYDLEADPGERHNLAGVAAHGRTQRDLHERLLAWYDPARNPFKEKRR
jgi:arylsulfatase A-like enzyme